MPLHTLSTAAPPARHFRLPTCPQCGDMLLAPLMAELVTSGHVRNHWACESCGHTFRKSFKVEVFGVDEALRA
jgi:RNase P subunit RPR2